MKRLALIITGDRHATDNPEVEMRWRELIVKHLGVLVQRYDWIVLIHGACGEDVGKDDPMKGIDRIAHETGRNFKSVAVVPLPARWGGTGKAVRRSAGPERNGVMLEAQDLFHRQGYDKMTIGYHDDLTNSAGTGGCIRESRNRGVKTYAFRSDESEWEG